MPSVHIVLVFFVPRSVGFLVELAGTRPVPERPDQRRRYIRVTLQHRQWRLTDSAAIWRGCGARGRVTEVSASSITPCAPTSGPPPLDDGWALLAADSPSITPRLWCASGAPVTGF